MMQVTTIKNQEFKTGWPRYTHSEGVPLEFEVKLAKRGEILDGTILKAFIDDSQQYQAEGRCWRAISICHMVCVGQRLEKEHVIGWREVPIEANA